jgi:hypothetical protein
LNGTREQVIDLGFVKITLVLSECPLQTGPVDVRVSIFTNEGLMKLDDFLQKNGSFSCEVVSKKVEKKVGKTRYDFPQYEDDIMLETPEEEKTLCIQEKGMSLESIRAKVNKVKSQYSKDPKDNIIYSY